MREYITNHPVRWAGLGALVASVFVGLLTLYAVPLSPPLGGCFGGALSDDPVHCYVLERANRAGVIDVEKVYQVEGGVLHFSLRADEPFGQWDLLASDIQEYFRAKTREFYERWPDDVPDLDHYDSCVSRLNLTYRECYLEVGLNNGLPAPEGAADIRFYAGGEKERRKVLGWPSWREVWPKGDASKAFRTPDTFDVSDVDLTNFPNYGCPETLEPVVHCTRDPVRAELVVGRYRGGYLEYKDPPEPDDAEEIAAIKHMFNPCYKVPKGDFCSYTEKVREWKIVDGVKTLVERDVTVRGTSYTSGEPKIIFIPAKYTAAQFRRWTEILNRFAHSQGNTIGIFDAEYSTNGPKTSYEDPVYTVNGPGGPAATNAQLRATIVVTGTTTSQRIADALPTLLPLLGIPVDTVGVVKTHYKGHNSYGGRDDSDRSDLGPQSQESAVLPELPEWFTSNYEWFTSNYEKVPVQFRLVAQNAGATLALGFPILIVAAVCVRRRSREEPGGAEPTISSAG